MQAAPAIVDHGTSWLNSWVRFLRDRQGTFATGSLVTIAFNCLAAALYAVGSMFVFRALGPEQSGHLIWFTTATTTVAVLSDIAGMYHSNAYLMASGLPPSTVFAARGTAMGYGLTVGLAAAALSVWCGPLRNLVFTGLTDPAWQLLVFLNVPGQVLLTQVRGVLWGQRSFILMGVLAIIKSGLYGISGAALAMACTLGWQIAAAQVATTWMCVLLFVGYFSVRGLSLPSLSYLRQCMNFGWRGAALYALSFLHLRSDQYMVTTHLGPSALGLYGAAVALADVITQVPSMMGTVLFGVVALQRDKRSAAGQTLRRVFATMAATLACTIPLAAWAPAIAQLLYGPNFAESGTLLRYSVPGIVLMSGLVLVNGHLSAVGYPAAQLLAALAAVAFNLGANAVLLPWLSVKGAPIAGWISYGVWFAIAVACLTRRSAANRGAQKEEVAA